MFLFSQLRSQDSRPDWVQCFLFFIVMLYSLTINCLFRTFLRFDIQFSPIPLGTCNETPIITVLTLIIQWFYIHKSLSPPLELALISLPWKFKDLSLHGKFYARQRNRASYLHKSSKPQSSSVNHIPRSHVPLFSPLIEKCKSPAEPLATNTCLAFQCTNLSSRMAGYHQVWD